MQIFLPGGAWWKLLSRPYAYVLYDWWSIPWGTQKISFWVFTQGHNFVEHFNHSFFIVYSYICYLSAPLLYTVATSLSTLNLLEYQPVSTFIWVVFDYIFLQLAGFYDYTFTVCTIINILGICMKVHSSFVRTRHT